MDERSVSHDQPFLARIYKEDVAPCLSFPNKEVNFSFVRVQVLLFKSAVRKSNEGALFKLLSYHYFFEIDYAINVIMITGKYQALSQVNKFCLLFTFYRYPF